MFSEYQDLGSKNIWEGDGCGGTWKGHKALRESKWLPNLWLYSLSKAANEQRL